jgi:hypothetical protein
LRYIKPIAQRHKAAGGDTGSIQSIQTAKYLFLRRCHSIATSQMSPITVCDHGKIGGCTPICPILATSRGLWRGVEKLHGSASNRAADAAQD